MIPLPNNTQPVVGQGGIATPAFYRFFGALARELGGSSDGWTAAIAAVNKRVDELDVGFVVHGKLSVASTGSAASGVISVSLVNDLAAPGNTYFYGTGTTGAKGWRALSSALSSTADISRTVSTGGVTTFGLADLADSGTGAALVRITRDGKGRVSGTHTATTSDLTEGTNLYYTDARVYAAAKVQLVAGTNVTITANDTAKTLTIAATGGSGGGIPEAPTDGQVYGRQNGAWVVVSSAGVVGFVAASGTTFSTVTSQTQTIPASVLAGDLLLACVMHRDTLTAPSGWTLVRTTGPVAGTTHQYTSVYKRLAVAGDAGSSTTWTQATSQRMAVHIQSYRKTGGCDVVGHAALSVDGTGTDTFAFTTPTAASGQMLLSTASISLAVTSGTSTMAASSPWVLTTPASSTDGSNPIRLASAYSLASTAGAGSGTFTCNAGSSANSWVGVSMVLG